MRYIVHAFAIINDADSCKTVTNALVNHEDNFGKHDLIVPIQIEEAINIKQTVNMIKKALDNCLLEAEKQWDL